MVLLYLLSNKEPTQKPFEFSMRRGEEGGGECGREKEEEKEEAAASDRTKSKKPRESKPSA